MGRIAAFVVASLLLVVASPARAQTAPDVDIFAPSFFTSAGLDDSVRFSWWAKNSQDFYRVAFSQTRHTGWETSPYSSRETVLTSLTATPRELNLAPGTWYWRICFGWNDTPGTCYLDDDIRTLEVTEPAPLLSQSEAMAATRQAVRRRYSVTPRVRCARINASKILCRADFRRRGRKRMRLVRVEARPDGVYYAFHS